jgi:hypothetical protein
MDSYIGFVSAGYSVKVGPRMRACSLAGAALHNAVCPGAVRARASQAIYWELLEMFRKLAMAAIGASRGCTPSGAAGTDAAVCVQGVFAVDGAFNAATTPDVSGALSPVVQPFLGQFVTGAVPAAACGVAGQRVSLTWRAAFWRAVLYLALLLWQRPFERPLHNVVQAVRARARCGRLALAAV